MKFIRPWKRNSHAEIEAEWDRKLMVMDGYNPVAHRLTDHIHPTKENAGVIQTFFPAVDAEQVKKATKER